MSTVGLFLTLFIGLVLTLFFANLFVALASQLAWALRISPLIIGTIITGPGTSMPELAVALNAIIKRDAGLAVANVVGSNIANIGLIIGLPILVRSIRIGSTKSQKNALILISTTFLFSILIAAGHFNRWWGFIFLLAGVLFFWWEVREGVGGRVKEDANLFELQSRQLKRSGIWPWLGVVLSLMGIFIGGWIVVDSSIGLAKTFGVSTSLIGLTVVAIGTSLPELTIGLIAAHKGEVKLLLGQTLGSNLYNFFLIAGLTGLLTPLYFNNVIGLVFLLVFTSLFVYIVRTHPGKYVSHRWGGLLLVIYFGYLLTLYFFNRYEMG